MKIESASLTIAIDWISVTFKEPTNATGQFIARFASRSESRSATPRNGYTAATKSSDGVLCMWCDNREEMGYHVIFDGTSLRNLFEHRGISATEVLTRAAHAGGSITRLDLAKDAYNAGVDLRELVIQMKDLPHEGSARKMSFMESSGGGLTAYIGSRTSERFIRIYDKAAEQHSDATDWKRFELELKGMVARAATSMICQGASLGSVFDGIARMMFDLPGNVHWEKFFTDGNEPEVMGKIQKVTDREKWIEEQVIAAVVQHYIDNPTSRAVERLRSSLDLLDKLKLTS